MVATDEAGSMSASHEPKRGQLTLVSGKPERDAPPSRSLPPVIAEFQSDAVELEERAPSKVARLTLYGVTALIAGAILWASLSSIDEVVVAPGKLITTVPTIVVQPLETGLRVSRVSLRSPVPSTFTT